jgi:hypothetical protein
MTEAEIEEFCVSAYLEFDHLGDYIWKLNHQIDELREIELAKLPDFEPSVRAFRCKEESYKLDYLFPLALNYSFVTLIFITLETRLLKTCNLLYESRNFPLKAKDLAGSGLERYINFLTKLVSIPLISLTHWPQISALTIIRNCIVHTSGFLENSRDEKALRHLVQNKSYLANTHRNKVTEVRLDNTNRRYSPEIGIENLDEGERLIINLGYSQVSCSYAREFLQEIFEKANLPCIKRG